jgi:hypothetical protein
MGTDSRHTIIQDIVKFNQDLQFLILHLRPPIPASMPLAGPLGPFPASGAMPRSLAPTSAVLGAVKYVFLTSAIIVLVVGFGSDYTARQGVRCDAGSRGCRRCLYLSSLILSPVLPYGAFSSRLVAGGVGDTHCALGSGWRMASAPRPICLYHAQLTIRKGSAPKL